MKTEAGLELTNAGLEYLYPQRCMQGDHYEVWRFPYVRDGVLYDEPDFVLVLLQGTRHHLHVFSPAAARTQDRDHLARIIWLVHDITLNFDLTSQVVDGWNTWDPSAYAADFERAAQAFADRPAGDSQPFDCGGLMSF